MDLAKLIIPSKEITTQFRNYDGFNIKVAYLTRDEIRDLTKRATTQKFSKRTRQPEEELDNDLFLDLYIDNVIKGWSGLKYEYLSKLIPIDLSAIDDKSTELDYTKNNARMLMKNCSELDAWIQDLQDDVENFTKNS